MIGACPASFDLIDPVLFTLPKVWIFGPFPIRWYALAYIAGLFGGLVWVLRLVSNDALWGTTRKTQTAPYSRAFVDDLVLWIMIGVIVGGRLGYVLFYNTSMICVTLAMVLTARAHAAPLLRVSDAVAAATPIGLFFGRMANFINGELWGRPAPDLPWAMRFSADPTCQLRHPSQLYEAALEGLVLFVILSVLIYRFKALTRPGLITGAFLIGYGVFRAFVELFREPDRQMPEALQGYVTMGMVLCIPMIALGAYLVWRARKAPAVGERAA